MSLHLSTGFVVGLGLSRNVRNFMKRSQKCLDSKAPPGPVHQKFWPLQENWYFSVFKILKDLYSLVPCQQISNKTKNIEVQSPSSHNQQDFKGMLGNSYAVKLSTVDFGENIEWNTSQTAIENLRNMGSPSSPKKCPHELPWWVRKRVSTRPAAGVAPSSVPVRSWMTFFWLLSTFPIRINLEKNLNVFFGKKSTCENVNRISLCQQSC